MIHNISRFITALAIILLTATTAGAQETITGLTYNSTGGYYEISDAQDLVDLANYVNATGNNTSGNNASGKTFKQTQDIDMSSAGNFEPIGSQPNNYNPTPFNGTYDGQGYAIIGLTVNTESPIAGLFGYMKGGSVRNLTMVNPNVTSNDNSQNSKYAGGIVGAISPGTIENCNVINPTLEISSENGPNIKGAICGGITDKYCAITDCYYYTTTNNYNAVGYNTLGVAYSASRTYTLTLNDGITTSTAPAFSYGDTEYYAGTITLAAAPMGWVYEYSVNDSPIDGNTFDISGNATVSRTAAHISPLLGYDDDLLVDGSAEHPYTIKTTEGWDLFCDLLADNTMGYFSGKTVQLGADITVTRMAGGSNHAFTGTFDGGGHTLTLAYGTADEPVNAQFVAPFVETANDGEHQPTFRNLTIAGSIYSGYATDGDKGTGGLIGHLFGGVTVEHCVSTVTVNAARDRAGGFVGLCEHAVTFTDCVSSAIVTCTGSGSGFVGWSRNGEHTIAFYGCLFDGKVLKQGTVGRGNGSFVGWKGFTKTVTITNCIAAPATDENMATDISATFCRYDADTNQDNGETHITNSYYTQTLGDAQGKALHTVTAGTDVTVAHAGVATHYATSGITAYKATGASADSNPFIAGLLYNNNILYAGSDDQLRLTLTTSAQCDQPGYQYGYTASAGTLSGTTLTMPDQDVTISVNTAELAPIDWATVNQGNSVDDPYMIYNKDQLLLLAHRVNGTNDETAVNNGYYGKFFKLGADITFSHDADEGDDYDENYEAIGGYAGGTYRNFKGNFDGDGHTVSGIRIRKTGSGDANSYQGLFGHINGSADIHDVHLTDARITGYENVGGIVGLNYGTVSGCSVTDSYIDATDNMYYGTICGLNGGTLTNNYYHGCTVNGTAVTSGVGCQEADIAANNGALPAYAITIGDGVSTTALASAPENGFVYNGVSYYREGLALPLASEAPKGYTLSFSANGTALSGNTYTVNATDRDVTITAALAPIDWETVNEGNSEDPYMIYNKDQLLLLAHRVNGTSGETANDYEGKYFKLGADITFDPNDLTLDEGQSNYEAIGGNIGSTTRYFGGTFDGDGHTVSGIRINKTGSDDADCYQGLFGLIGSGAEIHDVHLTDARIIGYANVGGIAGYNFDGNIMRCTVTDSYITATRTSYGTICGSTSNTSRLTNNYYHGCTVNGTAVTSGAGCSVVDITANNGALPAYAITFGDGVSTTALASAPENGFVYNGVSYYREGLALPLASTLASEVPAGYTLFSVNGTAFSGNTYTVNATDRDVTISATFSQDGDTYTIHTAGGWNVFCYLLADNDKGYFSGQTVTLGADITATTTVGTSDHPFTGTFDGNDKTLTVNISETSTQGTAPFRYISGGAVIKNLTVAGSVTGTTHAAGLVGFSEGGTSESPNTIEDCTVSTSVSGGSHNGGVVGHGLTSYLKIKNTVFSGSIANGSSYMGGLQGWSDGNHLTIDNCIFKGSWSGSGSFHPIAIHNPGSTTSATVSGAYYTVAPTLTDAAKIAATGTQVSTSAPSDVVCGPVTAADNQTYYAPVTVSGINKDYFYTGNEIAIDYTVTAADGTSLTKDTHYTETISPATVKDMGDYTLTLTGTGSYSGSQTFHFTVSSDINLPINGTKTLNLTEGIESFKVYDDGGKDGNYSDNCSGSLTINAPTGYVLQLSGSITTEVDCDKLTVYDNNEASGTKLLDGVNNSSNGTQTDITTVSSTGQSMTIYFNSDNSKNYAGLDLTVAVVNVSTDFDITTSTVMGGSITADKSKAKVGETVTLTATPDSGYLLGGISVKGAYNNDVAVTDMRWYTGINTATFAMPGSTVTVTPTFTNTLTVEGGLYINMPKTGTMAAIIPSGVKSFKVYDDGGKDGNYSNYCRGTLTLTVPAGYVLQLSGSITIETDFDNLTVYDNSEASGTKLLDGVSNFSNGTQTDITTVTSTGSVMTLYFNSDGSTKYAGLDLTVTVVKPIELADAADNTEAINGWQNGLANVTLQGRTLYKDGSWNTLCLPFAVDLTATDCPLSGDNVQAMTLNTTTSNLTGSTLTLNFDAATTIDAGTPFIIKWDESGTDITNPVFKDVTIDAEKHDATVSGVLTFTGTYAPVSIADNTKLYLGAANKLYYPSKARIIGCQRAYFQLLGDLTAGEPVSSSNPKQIRAFNLNFGDDEATGIVSAEANSSLFTLHSSLSEWYTLDGRKLDKQPTAKGLYIHGGKKVAIK